MMLDRFMDAIAADGYPIITSVILPARNKKKCQLTRHGFAACIIAKAKDSDRMVQMFVPEDHQEADRILRIYAARHAAFERLHS